MHYGLAITHYSQSAHFLRKIEVWMKVTLVITTLFWMWLKTTQRLNSPWREINCLSPDLNGQKVLGRTIYVTRIVIKIDSTQFWKSQTHLVYDKNGLQYIGRVKSATNYHYSPDTTLVSQFKSYEYWICHYYNFPSSTTIPTFFIYTIHKETSSGWLAKIWEIKFQNNSRIQLKKNQCHDRLHSMNRNLI